jgi:hypothetical protein
MAGGRLTYATSDCVDLTVERLELDENDVHQVAGKLCPEAGPLLTSKDGIWRVAGGFSPGLGPGALPGHAVRRRLGPSHRRWDQGGGRADGDGGRGPVVDATTPKRFETLAATGQATLANERWTGGFDLKGTGKAAATTWVG